MPAAVAAHLGVRRFDAPFVLEGGSIHTDGEGTLYTTEMCLLNPNRNPGMSKDEIEQGLRDYLGVDTVVWLPYGMAGDTGPVATDGHVDGVATVVAPGRILLLVPDDPEDADYAFGQANLERAGASTDARGRAVEAIHLAGRGRAQRLRELLHRQRAVVAPLTGAPSGRGGTGAARRGVPGPRRGGRARPPRSASAAAGPTASRSKCRSPAEHD